MKHALPLLLGSWLLGTAQGLAQEAPAPARQPLRVLFLGDPDTDRTKDFRSFLTGHFAQVRVADRWHWERSWLKDADVVVLDWGQFDGISKWMLGKDRTVEPRCPLGRREDWTTPMVMLGSAGLNIAWAWDTVGSFG